MKLKNRVCLITGASQGIGAALVRGFAQRGARVVATDLQRPTNPQAELNLAYDVRQAQRATEVVQAAVEHCGRLDVFIANAGIMTRESWAEISPDNWRAMMEVNLDGAWHGAQAAAGVMAAQGYGKIIFVSSVEVEIGTAVHCHYVSTKAALIGLTRSLARALGPQGVRVNCVMPGAIRTGAEVHSFPDSEKIAQWLAEKQCLPHRLTPEAIEPVFAFLSGEESDCVTGQVLCADHGLVHW